MEGDNPENNGIAPTESPAAEDSSRVIDGVLADILESDASSKEKAKVVEMMMMSSSQQMMTNGQSDISDKITEEHITKYLDGAEKNMTLGFKEETNKKWYNLAMVLLAIIILIFLVIFLKDTPDLLDKLITGIFSLIAGAIGGYGYGKNKSD
jgi:hypothetical protein